MKMKLDVIVTALLVSCAVVTTGLVIRREFFATPQATAEQPEQKPQFIENWRAHLAKGMRLGREQAPVQLIEFADFECPFCATYSKKLRVLRERYPEKIALTYVHYPLSMHRFAEPAARAAECAGAQGRFEAMYERLFEQQNAFGLKPWIEFAAEAGVTDMMVFEACIRSKEPVPRIAEGKALGSALDIKGTPTIVINGWKLARPPSIEELDVMVKEFWPARVRLRPTGRQLGSPADECFQDQAPRSRDRKANRLD